MNSTIIEFIVQSLNTAIMNLLIFLFCNKIYLPKYKSKTVYVVSFLLSTALFIFVGYIANYFNLGIINSIYLFVHMNAISFALFSGGMKKSFLYNTLYVVMLMFADILTVAFWSIMNGESFEKVLSTPQYLSISCITNILIMFLGWQIFVSVLSKTELPSIKVKQTFLLTIFTLFAAFVEFNFAIRINNSKDGIITILVLLGFLLISFLLVFFTGEIAKSYKAKQDLLLVRTQNQMQLEHYMDLSRKYEESRKIIHDVKKHIATLYDLRNINNESAEEYGLIIQKQMDSLFTGFQCSNQILGIIMSQKISVAEKENIKIDTQIEDLSFDFIEDVDMTAIFANLWDNAIEACKKINDNRFINITIGQSNDFIIISFENSFDGNIKKSNKLLKSTKNNHEGIGLSIIESTIEKYEGKLNVYYNNNVFNSEILIPINQNK